MVATGTCGLNKKNSNGAKQLIKLLQGLLDGEFELNECTRSNKESDDGTVMMNFGFDVIQKAPRDE